MTAMSDDPDDPLTHWRTENAVWLNARLEHLRLQLPRRSPDADEPPERLASALADAEARLEACTTAMAPQPALKQLATVLGLKAFEQNLVMLAVAPELDARFARLYAYLHDDARRDHATLQLALEMFVKTPEKRIVKHDALLPSLPLRRLRVLGCDEPPGEPLLTRPLRLDERMVDYLRGVNRLDARLEGIVQSVPVPVLTPGHRRISKELAGIIRAVGERWPVVSLVGAAALGARDVAAKACASVGVRLLEIDVRRLAGQPQAERRELVALLAREALLMRLAYFLDGDAITDVVDAALRSVLTTIIEELEAVSFVVSHERWPGDAVTHVVHVPRPNRADQRRLWRDALGEQAESAKGTIDRITQQFDFGPSAIAAAVRLAQARTAVRRSAEHATEADATTRDADVQEREEIVGEEREAIDDVECDEIDDEARDELDVPADMVDLWDACREQGGLELNDLAERLVPSYCWSDIILPAPLLALLHELKRQVGHRAQVYEVWGFGPTLGRGRGITALFAGPSGTGKTMAAEILAKKLRLDLYRIDLAGVVSKYIGETEKNLRRVFDAAERTGAILFFDEADALFGARTEVRDSHDRYANIEVNYLLQRMEGYTGLAILATNRKSALDAAFLRRLRFVLDFPFPSVEDRRRIWQRVFPKKARLDGVDYGFLARLELAGGNIRSVAVNAAFLAAAERDANARAIGMRHLVRAAAQEYRKIERPISAAEFGPFYAMVRL